MQEYQPSIGRQEYDLKEYQESHTLRRAEQADQSIKCSNGIQKQKPQTSALWFEEGKLRTNDTPTKR